MSYLASNCLTRCESLLDFLFNLEILNSYLPASAIDLDSLQTMEVRGQEILTKDRVSLRINLSASYRTVDTEKVATLLKNHTEFLYREFQLALR